MNYLALRNEAQTTYIKSRVRICSLVCCCLLLCCWLLLYAVWEQDIKSLHASVDFQRNKKKEEKLNAKTWDEFVIMQPGCRIPGMAVFGPAVDGYLRAEAPENCEYRKMNKKSQMASWLPPLVQTTKTGLAVDKSALKYYDRERVYCTYQSFRRSVAPLNESHTTPDSAIEYSELVQEFVNDSATINSESHEFVRVICNEKRRSKKRAYALYQDYFAFVPLKKEVETRCDDFDRSSRADRISVMVVGLDALSRLHFYRQMPESAAYLEQMDAIEMLGFNKVGDNTFPNLVPTLSGMSVDELAKTCWSTDSVFDECPMIWKRFQDNGYRTVFAEDSPNIGVFNYLKSGFDRQPADYYLRPFYLEAENHIGFHKPMNCYLCLGPRLSLSVLLDYAARHANTWSQKSFFGFFWGTSFTHDAFNLSPRGDAAVLTFLKQFHVSNATASTVLVMMSDHGLRWGPFRETYQGHLEERLPLLSFVFPPWFQRRYPRAVQNLRRNVNMLTTHFDLHETLLEFGNLTGIEDEEIARRTVPADARGRSLFVAVPETRNCSAAGIPKNYCTCHDKVETLEVNDPRAIIAADVLVAHINDLLIQHPECAQLRLKRVEQTSVEVSTMGGKFASNHTRSNLMITAQMIPGDGMFEASVRYEPRSHAYEVVGQVSRINTYGSQSFCINDYVLKLYCYCKL